MKVLLTLSGSLLLCVSFVSEASTLKGAVHSAAWFADVPALGCLVRFESLSEPAWLVVLGAGFVFLAHPIRRKRC